MFSKLVLALVALNLGLAVGVHAAAPQAPSNLLVNGIATPQAVDNTATLFTWMMNATNRGAFQSACQILVASSQASLDANLGDVWDSGKMMTTNSASVAFGGPALAPATRYWWKVRLWNQNDEVSPYSAAATFDVGLSKPDWTASYIWDGTSNPNNFAWFRKSFTVSKPVRLAKLFVSAHNDYQLNLNGAGLGFGPARSNPNTYGQYVGHDVTAQLNQGVNVFAAQAHWHGVWNDSGINANPAFVLECRITFTDGTTQTIKSDGTWKTLASTPFIETSPTYFGGAGGANNRAAIRYDARQEIAGWTGTNFNDSAWANATVVDRSTFNLFAQRVANQVEAEQLAPVSVTASGSDWIVDFGRCITGWPLVTLRDQSAGTVVTINYYQLGNGSGGAGWDQYTCKDGTETWNANFGRHTSFRTLRITGYTGTLSTNDIRAVVAHTDATVAGDFECSSAFLNSVFQMCERSARQNVQQGIISVDANREQSPWTADSHNIGHGLLYNHRNTLILDKIVRDYAGEQTINATDLAGNQKGVGNFWACSPAAIYVIPEWSMYWELMLWQQYLFSGDARLLADTYPNLTNWLAYLEPYRQGTGLLDIPGWRIADYTTGAVMENDGQNITLNALYYENLRIAANVAATLGRAAEAGTYATKADQLKTAINANLFTGGNSYFTKVGSSQRLALGAAWALRFGIVPEASKSAVAAWIRSQDVLIGGYGGEAFYSGTYECGGLGDFIVADLFRYQEMLGGNQTCWEDFSKGGEFNHAWTAYPAHIFPRYIAGIQPTGPGFATFNIKPEVRGLSSAQATVPTVRGDITSRWDAATPGQLSLNCTVPANSTALIHVPISTVTNAAIREGGTLIWTNGVYSGGVPGILSCDGADDRFVRLVVGSGSYDFQVAGKPLAVAVAPLLRDSFTVSASSVSANAELEQRQSGVLAPVYWRSHFGNADWQSQVGNSDNGNPDTLLLAGFSGTPIPGETLAANFATSNSGPLTVRFDARLRNNNGDNAHWTSFCLSGSPFGGSPFITDSTAAFGILFRGNSATEVWREGTNLGPTALSWTSDATVSSTIKVVISDTAGTGSPFTGNGSVARVYSPESTLIGSYPLTQLTGAYFSFGTYMSLWEVANLNISTVSLAPASLDAVVSGTNLVLSWPADHVGWALTNQTNRLNLGVSGNLDDWQRLAGSELTNQLALPFLVTQPAGFYRLTYP